MSLAATAMISTPPETARLDRMMASGPSSYLTLRSASLADEATNFLTFMLYPQ